MANIKSAKKQARRSEKCRVFNLARKSSIKTAIKKLFTAIDAKEGVDTVKGLFRDAEAQLSRAKRKVLHPNTAARKVSRLAKRVAEYSK